MKKDLRKLLLIVPGVTLLLAAGAVFADTVTTDFESFSTGTVDGQQGWIETNATYDQAIVDPDGFVDIDAFGDRSLRFSNAVASGAFDWTFAAPTDDAAGEADATANGFPVGDRTTHFEVEFDVASAVPASEQPGLAVWMSPDRGDGSRMSFLKFIDTSSGIDVQFYDVQGTTNPATFVPTMVATGLDRSVPHHILLTLDFVDGPSNDVVRVYIDDVQVHTGTSWENYYRYDSEAAAEQTPRLVKTIILQARGDSVPGVDGFGFLFDNLSLISGEPPVEPPDDTEDCYEGGWETYNDPAFGSAVECITYVVTNDDYSSYRAMIRALSSEIREYYQSLLPPQFQRGSGRWR